MTAWRDDWMTHEETLMDAEPPFDPAEAAAAIERASRELGEICRQGARNRFRMSIPAQPDRDSDLIIAAGLNAGDLALAELAAKPSPLVFPRKGMTDEEAAEWKQRFTEAVSVGRYATGVNTSPRFPQAAGDANDPGDDAGAAHDPHGAAAGNTGPRMDPQGIAEAAWDAYTQPAATAHERLAAALAAVIPAIGEHIATAIEANPMSECSGAVAECARLVRNLTRGDQ